MMGGMRSILELGFAGVAFYNFGSKSWSLIKKIFMFLFNTSSRFASFLGKFIPIEQIKNILITATGSKGAVQTKNVLVSVIRIILIAFLVIGYKLRQNIK